MLDTHIRRVSTSTLDICYEETGNTDRFPVILLHGFPDDIRTYDGVIPDLVKQGYRTLVPYLRGYGKTRFLHSSTLRSGQQAALGNDLIEFMDCLNIKKAILAGYDWGGRAACIVSALWPERIAGLVTVTGYNIQNILEMKKPEAPEQEFLYWYMWYFATERGRLGLEQNRRKLCRLLWDAWSPNFKLTDEEFERTAKSFDNPDFVDVIIHSYRHRFSMADGDPALEHIESKLANQPMITIPTIILESACDGLNIPGSPHPNDSAHFSQLRDTRVIPVVGHFLPRENPASVVQAILDLS